jgi:hypothetical protein
MATTYDKLVKADGKPADELEKQVSNALTELMSTSEIKAQLSELYFVGAQVNVFIYTLSELNIMRLACSNLSPVKRSAL